MLPARNAIESKARMEGTLTAVHIPRHGFYHGGRLPAGTPLAVRIRSFGKELALRWRLFFKGAWRGLMGTGVVGVGRLYASVIRGHGGVEHLGLICTKVVTNAGVNYIRDDWNSGANDINLFNFHGVGTTNTAENATDTALAAESTTVLNPDSTRATGTRSVPGTGQCQTVGTLTFDGSAAIVEHGIFTQAATGGGTLLDRSVFSTINVANLDSIQFTYVLTLSAGG